MKDLGRIGYEAARKDAGGLASDGRYWPTWEDLAALPHGVRTRRAWAAGALAILAALRGHCGSEICDGVNDERTPREGSERPFCSCPCAGCGAAKTEEEQSR